MVGFGRLQPGTDARPHCRRHRLRRPGPVRPLATRPHLPGLRRLPITVCRAHRHQPGNSNSDAGCLEIAATPGPCTGPGQAHLLPVAAAVFLATWATGAFYQAFVPALVEDQLHTRGPLILGLVFAAYMTPSVLGAPIGGRFTSAVAQRVGMITFLAGMIGIITAIAAGTLVLFIIATIVAGAGQGIAISAATRGLLHGSTLADRAPIFSAIYLLCYSGATFPSLISGQLSNTFSLPQIAFGYGVLAPRRHPVHCPRCTQSAR